MKKIIYSLLTFVTSVILALISATTSTFAAATDYITIQTVSGNPMLTIKEFSKGAIDYATIVPQHDPDYFRLDQDMYDDPIANSTVKIHALYQNFEIWYKDVNQDKVLYKTNGISFDFIEIRFPDFWNDNTVEFYINGTSKINVDVSNKQIRLVFHGIDLAPAFSGQENFVTSVDDPKPVEYFLQFITAWDETDGNITDKIIIDYDEYSTNKYVLGTYKVELSVEDSSGNESYLTIYITVADVTSPVISGNQSKVQISYTQTWNINAFKSTLSVTDNYYQMTNDDIAIESDNYSQNKTQLGKYNVVFSATDPSGNKTTFTKEIEVIDDIAPVFSGPTLINKPLSSILTIADIKSQLSAFDEKEGNKTSYITVLSDSFTGNGNKAGQYTVVFEVSDSKGNKAQHTVTVVVQDNIPPIWYIQDGMSVKIVPPAKLTRDQIIDLLVATGQLNLTATTNVNFVLDEYTGNETTPGVYLMTLSYRDTAGNEGIQPLTITVLESDEESIIVDPTVKDFFNDIIDWINNNQETVQVIGIVVAVTALGVFVLFLVKRSNKKVVTKKRRRK